MTPFRPLLPALESEEPSVNLTPLLDVVFVILIAFILVAPLLPYEQVELVASHTKVETIKSSPIAIGVTSDNAILINNERVTKEALASKLAQLYKSFPEAIPQLYQDRNASFGIYYDVKEAASQAGFSQLDLVLK